MLRTRPSSSFPGAVEKSRTVLAEKPETGQRLERVANLVEGFESPFGLELLATVHLGRNARGRFVRR